MLFDTPLVRLPHWSVTRISRFPASHSPFKIGYGPILLLNLS